MEGINRVTLLGNLCSEPELRSTSGGQAVLKFRMATNESYLDKNRERKEKTEYHSIVIWGKRGEALSRILQKGALVLVEGANRTSSYDDKDGNKRYKTEVNATNIVLCGGRGQAQTQPAPAAAGVSADYDDSIYGSSKDDDDLPF